MGTVLFPFFNRSVQYCCVFKKHFCCCFMQFFSSFEIVIDITTSDRHCLALTQSMYISHVARMLAFLVEYILS